MVTWKALIAEAMEENGETWRDVKSSTLTKEQIDAEFDDGFGGSEGAPFTLWTAKHVYFPAVYDGSEWVAWVSRNPDGQPTSHIGGE